MPGSTRTTTSTTRSRNIRGKDRDLGYEIMRIDPHQNWHPVYLLQPLYNLVLMGFFEWGVALHDMNFDAIRSGEKSKAQALVGAEGDRRQGAAPGRQGLPRVPGAVRRRGARRQARADLQVDATGRTSPPTSCATSGRTRSSSAGTSPTRRTRSARARSPRRRAAAGTCASCSASANIDGSPLFHLLSGNLSFQVEHHLFPDMPSSRYAEIAPRVRDICRRYGLPYNTGPLSPPARHRAPHDPAAGVPGRQAAAEARAACGDGLETRAPRRG